MDKLNVEIVGYPFEIKATDTRKDFEFFTKPEHKKILGVFLGAENDKDLSQCYIEIGINNRNIVSYNPIQASLLQKTKYLSIEDTAWKEEIEVNNSVVKLTVTENNSTEDIKANLYLIVERNA